MRFNLWICDLCGKEERVPFIYPHEKRSRGKDNDLPSHGWTVRDRELDRSTPLNRNYSPCERHFCCAKCQKNYVEAENHAIKAFQDVIQAAKHEARGAVIALAEVVKPL